MLYEFFPEQASVQNNGKHFCGGFLIRKNIVLTAAHCDKKEHSNVTVVLGTNDLSRVDESTMRYNVKKCKHCDYKEVSLGNDIMMLKGDSGGPLVCNNVAVGIVSFNLNKNCANPNVPNIYTEISKFVAWIDHPKKC
ncbi:Chymase [Merluccius polli]|uniref:trypsin n=1 Tax=Merluccius polli TaxID=89951 RepID=A0AA47MMZ2_MERPO|nr:Chymase [Merluccius polli]